ncbi:AsmA-like protein [Azonexus fungiphilus]|uniref:AsmA-like protein n=1 Tax=Azonexus fungiphilus TaxID=146940 RepID=A0A495WIN6_9RHOO|nr:AsmA-like protein [Azonexus fungiphilus]
MNSGQIYAKTPTGDEAVRQSTRVVQRNLRLVLVQVDGKLTVGELAQKIGNARLVENAIRELESGGYIVPLAGAAAAWEVGIPVAPRGDQQVSAISQFSTFGASRTPSLAGLEGRSSKFSSFGKPILPATRVDAEPRLEASPMPHEEVPEPLPGARRSPLGMLLAGLLILLLGAALVFFFYPYGGHKADVERAATGMLQVPVTVDGVSMRFLPAPALVIDGMRVEGGGKIDQVRLGAPWKLVFGGVDSLAAATLSGVRFTPAQLLALPGFDSRSLPLAALRQVTVEDFGLLLPGGTELASLNGRLQWSGGRFEQAVLETPDRGLLIKARPQSAAIALEIEGRAWKPGALPISFAALQARGVLYADRLQVSEIDTTVLGGVLKGDWLLTWSGSGLAMSGAALLARLDLRQVAAALAPALKIEGELAGNLRWQGQAGDWDGLWPALAAQLAGEVSRGVIHGVDLGEAARRGPGAQVRGGATRFDKLDAALTLDAGGLTMRNIRLDAGLMTASGQVAANAGGDIDGRLLLLARSSVATVRVPLLLGGRPGDIGLTVER